MSNKMLDLVVNQPAGPLFDPSAQKWIAIGVIIFLTLWGASKIMKAWRK